MANGCGKNWSRIVSLVVGFKSEFGSWPDELELPSWLIANLREKLSPNELMKIEKRVRLKVAEPGMVAVDKAGHRHKYSLASEKVEFIESAVEWLGGRPDWSQSGDPADKQANHVQQGTR